MKFLVSPTDSQTGPVYDFSYILRYAHAMFFNFRTKLAAAKSAKSIIKEHRYILNNVITLHFSEGRNINIYISILRNNFLLHHLCFLGR